MRLPKKLEEKIENKIRGDRNTMDVTGREG
jgi:hypothetical protein